MKLARWVRRFVAIGRTPHQTLMAREVKRWSLLDRLDENERQEDQLNYWLQSPHASRVPAGIDVAVEAIFSTRDRRVAILRELGWNDEADKLEADTAMRRGWTK